MVQLRIVKHDQARVAKDVGPHVIVAPRVADLKHDEVVSAAVGGPDEIVGAVHGEPNTSSLPGRDFFFRSDVDLDLVTAAQVAEQLDRVVGDAAPRGRQRRKDREAHGSDDIAIGFDFASNRSIA